MNTASSNFIISMTDFIDVQHYCHSQMGFIDPASCGGRFKIGKWKCRRRWRGGELNNKKKIFIYVLRGAPGCVFKLANQQLIFKEEVKPRSAEKV